MPRNLFFIASNLSMSMEFQKLPWPYLKQQFYCHEIAFVMQLSVCGLSMWSRCQQYICYVFLPQVCLWCDQMHMIYYNMMCNPTLISILYGIIWVAAIELLYHCSWLFFYKYWYISFRPNILHTMRGIIIRKKRYCVLEDLHSYDSIDMLWQGCLPNAEKCILGHIE